MLISNNLASCRRNEPAIEPGLLVRGTGAGLISRKMRATTIQLRGAGILLIMSNLRTV
jgi:hypothetical protein